MAEHVSLPCICIALALHLATIYLGYRFHLWLVENGRAQSSWWRFGSRSDSCGTFDMGSFTSSSSKLSAPQIAFCHTFTYWLLIIAFVFQWRYYLILVIIVGAILLEKEYPSGTLGDSKFQWGTFAFLAWMSMIAFSASLLLWGCGEAIFVVAGDGYGVFRLIASSVAFVAFGSIAALSYHRQQGGNVDCDCGGIESSFVMV